MGRFDLRGVNASSTILANIVKKMRMRVVYSGPALR